MADNKQSQHITHVTFQNIDRSYLIHHQHQHDHDHQNDQTSSKSVASAASNHEDAGEANNLNVNDHANNNDNVDDDEEKRMDIGEKELQDYFNTFSPGYRFCPLDSELIVDYLRKKIKDEPLPPHQIRDVNIYKYTPDKISEMYPVLGEKEWYFFTPRDKKYLNGTRPNRAAGTGYWKATGADRPITSDGVTVGFRKALVFYQGKAPKGDKTNWIMHEFRVNAPPRKKSNEKDMRLDDYVLCRIYKKINRSFNGRSREGTCDGDIDDQVNNECLNFPMNIDPKTIGTFDAGYGEYHHHSFDLQEDDDGVAAGIRQVHMHVGGNYNLSCFDNYGFRSGGPPVFIPTPLHVYSAPAPNNDSRSSSDRGLRPEPDFYDCKPKALQDHWDVKLPSEFDLPNISFAEAEVDHNLSSTGSSDNNPEAKPGIKK